MRASYDDLQAQVRRLTVVTGALAIALAAFGIAAFMPGQPDILRTRGIIVEDAAGRERILIGAPIPTVANRVRTDSARARQAWASRFPNADQYMGFYAGYRHGMHGMLVLDENGFDRVAIGDSTPDPNIGRRIGPATGVLINDAEGFERSGYGLLTVNGRYRVVLGLDSDRGAEGVALSLIDGSYMGLSIYGPGGSLAFLGSAPADRLGVPDSVFGLVLRREDRVEHMLNVAGRR